MIFYAYTEHLASFCIQKKTLLAAQNPRKNERITKTASQPTKKVYTFCINNHNNKG